MDKQYWTDYYKKDLAPHEPTQFAQDISGLLLKEKKLLELGCGNGRDSIFFSKLGLNVTAIDQAITAIKQLEEDHKEIDFNVGDFITDKLLDERTFDYIYSRFTLHSITEDQEKLLLKRVYNVLQDNGIFFIETRCVKDDIYGLGEKVGDYEFIYQNHYRRFAETDYLVKKLGDIGFKDIEIFESRGFAVHKNEDPIVLRVYAKK